MVNKNILLFNLKIKISFLIIFVLIMNVNSILYSETYYVNSSRPDDGGNGLSWATAKKTLTAFAGMLSAGDTVVAKGAWGRI